MQVEVIMLSTFQVGQVYISFYLAFLMEHEGGEEGKLDVCRDGEYF